MSPRSLSEEEYRMLRTDRLATIKATIVVEIPELALIGYRIPRSRHFASYY
jgi:hypothetical protein